MAQNTSHTMPYELGMHQLTSNPQDADLRRHHSANYGVAAPRKLPQDGQARPMHGGQARAALPLEFHVPTQTVLSAWGRQILTLILLIAGVGCANGQSAYQGDAQSKALHQRATLIDLHADPTLWNVDVQVAEDRQAALPQLHAGAVDAAIFGIPSQGFPIIGGWALFTWWRGYPKAARRSSWAAASHQIQLLHDAASGEDAPLVLVSNYDEFMQKHGQGKTLGLIGVEGGHAIEGDLTRLQTLKDWGVFYIGPIHLSDNELGGSNFEWGPIGPGAGLTDLGREFIVEAHQLGLVIDLAHASAQTFDEILALSDGPVMVSHTGLRGVYPSWRNLSDEQVKAIADRKGVVGIMFGNHFLGDDDLDTYLDHIVHGVRLVGAEYIAIGTDFDGMVPLPDEIDDAGDMAKITVGLLEKGLSEAEVEWVLGKSFLRFMQHCQAKKAPDAGTETPTPSASTTKIPPSELESMPKNSQN